MSGNTIDQIQLTFYTAKRDRFQDLQGGKYLREAMKFSACPPKFPGYREPCMPCMYASHNTNIYSNIFTMYFFIASSGFHTTDSY